MRAVRGEGSRSLSLAEPIHRERAYCGAVARYLLGIVGVLIRAIRRVSTSFVDTYATRLLTEPPPCGGGFVESRDLVASELRLALCELEQLPWHPDWFACGQVDGSVARVACDEDFSVAEHLVIEAE